MTRQAIRDRIKAVASSLWTKSHLDRELDQCDRLWPGDIVCWEDRYMGKRQGIQVGQGWRDKSETSGRVHFIGIVD